MSTTERYAQRTYESRGLLRQRNLAILRNYIKTAPEEDVRKEILLLTELNHIKVLWEAGLTLTLQEAALRRYGELIARRG